MMASVAYREGREVTLHISRMAFSGLPNSTQRIRRRAGTVRFRCERSEGGILHPLAKPSLPLNVARNFRRVGRESGARSRL